MTSTTPETATKLELRKVGDASHYSTVTDVSSVLATAA